MIRVTIKLFAVLREKAGVSDLALELADGATLAEARAALAGRLPAVAPLLARVAFAVNREYVPLTTVLHDGDEVAALPPVSGGAGAEASSMFQIR